MRSLLKDMYSQVEKFVVRLREQQILPAFLTSFALLSICGINLFFDTAYFNYFAKIVNKRFDKI